MRLVEICTQPVLEGRPSANRMDEDDSKDRLRCTATFFISFALLQNSQILANFNLHVVVSSAHTAGGAQRQLTCKF